MVREKKRLVFVGGGHAHLYSLKHAHRFPPLGVETTLIAPSRHHYYSGMGPGMLSGTYEPEQIRFDVKALIESGGGDFVKGKVDSIDPEKRMLILESGERIDYDFVSFNVGSRVVLEGISGAKDFAFAVKPIENLENIRKAVLDTMRKGAPKICVIGGGPAGVELAGNIWRLVQENQGRADIAVVNSGDRLLPAFHQRARRLARKSLTKRGIRILDNFRVQSIDRKAVVSRSDTRLDCDVAVLATGVVPPTIFARSGLRTSEDGALLVSAYLQSVEYPEIFGGGDCITVEGHPFRRIGVYAVRQAPILFQNLLSYRTARPVKPFRSRRHYGLIMNMGDGRGIYAGKYLAWSGRLAFRLKHRIDTRFMSQFRLP